MSLLPFAALVAFTYYLLARAEITRWWWEGIVGARALAALAKEQGGNIDWRAADKGGGAWGLLDRLLRCPMCCGWWLGLAAALVIEAPSPWPGWWARLLWGGIYGLVLNPIATGLMYQFKHREEQLSLLAGWAVSARMPEAPEAPEAKEDIRGFRAQPFVDGINREVASRQPVTSMPAQGQEPPPGGQHGHRT